MIHRCIWLCKAVCWLGLHRWQYPGGYCDCCGIRDNFFDIFGEQEEANEVDC